MSLQYIFFDLDGTLLPMDQNRFIKVYFSHLAAKLAPKGIDEKALVETIWGGTKAMVANDGSRTNEEVFWDHFVAAFGPEIRKDQATFDDFYRNEFQLAQSACGFDPRAAKTVAELKARGFTLVLATNPIFPAIATGNRMQWAGLKAADFELVTTYENSHFCKPNLDYYQEILRKIGEQPENCIMVGNDVTEDMAALELGMQVFLLTDCMINKENKDISQYPHGSFDALQEFLEQNIRKGAD
jgi:FMN phosphatase YigB (HAD superfamily)